MVCVNHGKHRKAGEFQWCYKKDFHLFNNKKIRAVRQSKPVLQYDLDCNFIREYESASEAGRILGVDKSGIIKVANNQRSLAANSKWVWKTTKKETM